jgi:hypothetical protein
MSREIHFPSSPLYNSLALWCRWQSPSCIDTIITIAGKTAFYEPLPSLQDSVRFILNYTVRFSLLRILQYFFCRTRSSASRPTPNLEDHVPQWQGGPVIPPGTGFPFCRLLWLAGLQTDCRYIASGRAPLKTPYFYEDPCLQLRCLVRAWHGPHRKHLCCRRILLCCHNRIKHVNQLLLCNSEDLSTWKRLRKAGVTTYQQNIPLCLGY